MSLKKTLKARRSHHTDTRGNYERQYGGFAYGCYRGERACA